VIVVSYVYVCWKTVILWIIVSSVKDNQHTTVCRGANQSVSPSSPGKANKDI